MQKITPFLWFDTQAEEAAIFYTSVFKNAHVKNVAHYSEAGPGPSGSVMSVTFELEGQEYIALNGGPVFSFSPAISFFVHCQTQDEIDELWQKLTADGGKPGQCGWLEDKFGVSWQIVPDVLNELMSDPDPAKAERVTKAMLAMHKLDIAELQRAHDQ